MDEQARYLEFLSFLKKAYRDGSVKDIIAEQKRKLEEEIKPQFDRAQGWPLQNENNPKNVNNSK